MLRAIPLSLWAFLALACLALAGALNRPTASESVHAWTQAEEQAYVEAYFAEAPRR